LPHESENPRRGDTTITNVDDRARYDVRDTIGEITRVEDIRVGKGIRERQRMASDGGKSNGSGTLTRRRVSRAHGSGYEFVVCINNAKYPASLERHKIYRVVPDKDAARNSDVRVMCAGDDVSRNYLSGDVSKSQYYYV